MGSSLNDLNTLQCFIIIIIMPDVLPYPADGLAGGGGGVGTYESAQCLWLGVISFVW
jgi:hypothetical protein